MRILEFPRYANFAQSFANTVPYSEDFGWVGDFSDPEDTDYAFNVTAHEVAHQWWAHQVTPSATRGSNQISESMAEYAALMVLKEEYGEEAIFKFLEYEVNSYLRGRSGESKFEKTLMDNDNQAYVWYRKGGSILYALQDYITADSLNLAFANYIKAAAFRAEAPFTTTLEWFDFIQAKTPDSLRYFLDDSFHKITLYENRMKEATYTDLGNDEYEVTLKFDSQKIYYDGNGKELERGLTPNLLEIGIFAEDGKNETGMTKKMPLFHEKRWIEPGEQSMTIRVKGKPVKAGIDPYNKMIDRVSDDNLMNCEEAE
jgi:aminopeptidase N